MPEYDAELRKCLAALFTLFQDKPHILINYLMHYNALKKDFRERIKTNDFLRDISRDLQEQKEIQKPYFVNLQEMQQYYNQAFHRVREGKTPSVLGASNDHETLLAQLRDAVRAEDYSKAARIKKYMEELGMDSNLF